jgi:hypothetical protein
MEREARKGRKGRQEGISRNCSSLALKTATPVAPIEPSVAGRQIGIAVAIAADNAGGAASV